MDPIEPTPAATPQRSPDRLSATRFVGLTVAQSLAELGVDPATGLSTLEVDQRRAKFGSNRLAERVERPQWKKFLDQFRSGIVAILAAAAVIAGAVGDIKDTVVIAVVLVVNAVLGYLQEAKAETAMAALERMLVATVRVRRGGELVQLPVDELVPGDVVLLEPGDRVPADGRLLVAAGLSIDESALTGESVPVDKGTDLIDAGPDADLEVGDRANLAYLNTTVTRGRAELLVTGTGMNTEMGKVAGLLADADPGPTPLERQLDALTTRLAIIAGGAVALVFFLQLSDGVPLGEAALGAVALAVAAIPEGLPAVVTVTLAVGVNQMAKRNAIVKRLHSVETLGSTTVICSDKTGTLTLNQMTARELVRGGTRVAIDGLGYGIDGVLVAAGSPASAASAAELGDVSSALRDAALCSDAEVRDATLVGDPTEGALVVMAAKGGVDVAALRSEFPRIGEVPFDSAAKYMATFHRDGGEVLCIVKGAIDRLLERCTAESVSDGPADTPERRVLLDNDARRRLEAENDRLAAGGLRVLALASRRLPASAVALADDGTVVDPEGYVGDLTLDGLVGILDPPRDEARDAIARCRVAGIEVKMITGDHAATAGAIARSLGLDGDVVSGAELDAMTDDDLAARIDGLAVCARVSPEHKVRVVRALRSNGHVVAMTGDGVNDAAALRTADIGVAMGITGTEVTKEAADMVLADDNFATIVGAVERGRTIYANIVTFVRFQMATSLGAIATILGASLIGVPVPFSPLQVLWINLLADGPPALTLGVDPPDSGVMQRSPRAADAAILDTGRIARLVGMAVVMAFGSLWVLVYAEHRWGDAIALSMTFTTFVLFQMFNVFNCRTANESVFSRKLWSNPRLLAAVGSVLVLQMAAVVWTPLQNLFGTVDLDPTQTAMCFAVASLVLWVEELRKVVTRAWLRRAARAALVAA
jgi:Ca2+-transporting ATPase